MDNNFNENEESNVEEKVQNEQVKTENNNIEPDVNEENNIENPILEKKEDKKNNILFICMIGVLLVLIGGYFLYTKVLVKDNNKPKENEQKEENKEESKEEKKEEETQEDEVLNYTLDVYKQESGYFCKEKSDYCKDVAFTIKTQTNDAKILYVSEDYILYNDNQLKIYNVKSKNVKKVKLENSYNQYTLIYDSEGNVQGILYTSINKKSGYYNISTNTKMYDLKYDNLYGFNDGFLRACKDKSIYLLNIDNEKEELVYNTGNSCDKYIGLGFEITNYNGKNFYRIVGEPNTYMLYSNSKKVIYDKEIKEEAISFNNEFVYFVDGNNIKKYDIDGNLSSTYNLPNNFKGLIANYAVYVENENLSLMDTDKNKSVVLDKWNDDYYFDTWQISGVYSRDRLDKMGENNKPAGVYVVVYYKNGKDAKGNYGMEYCYTTTGEIRTFEVKTQQGGRAKPVLYLYPTKETNVKVEFSHSEYLTTTYPKYNKSWEVKAYPNGDLYDSNNKYYYGLYWDEIRYNEVDFHEGFYVTKDNTINFLEEKLELIGLNNRERNEFIMYWLPILENNEKSIVYFELTKERERGNKLIITPKPDSMLRVSIHIKKVSEKVNIKEQKLEKFERFGFSAIEWGGMTY